MFRKSAFSLGASTKNTQGLLHRPAGPQLPNILPTESGESVWSTDGSHFLRLLLLWMPQFMLTCSTTEPPYPHPRKADSLPGWAMHSDGTSDGAPDTGTWSLHWLGSFLATFPLQITSIFLRESEAPKVGIVSFSMFLQAPSSLYPPSPENPLFQPPREYQKKPTLIDQKQNSSNQK